MLGGLAAVLRNVSLPFSHNDRPDRVQLQVVSDLHLEYGNQYLEYNIAPRAPDLVLAGDTGSLAHYEAYVAFLSRHCAQFEHVYLLLGNHEFYGSSHEKTIDKAHQLEKEPCFDGKLTLLHRKRVDLDHRVTVLGCTLWTHIPEESREPVVNRVKDYRSIDSWTVDQHNHEHTQDVAWLKEQLFQIQEEDSNRRIVVVTHHAPTCNNTSNPIHVKNAWTPAFSSPLLEGEAKVWKGIGNISHWIFGHTHWTTEFRTAGLTLIANQRGYSLADSTQAQTQLTVGPNESIAHVFDPNRVVLI